MFILGFLQNANYSLTQYGSRERVNAQVALQYSPVDTFTASAGLFYFREQSRDERRSDLSVWFEPPQQRRVHGQDGPIRQPAFLR